MMRKAMNIVYHNLEKTEETEYIRFQLEWKFNGANVPIVFERINLILKDDSGKVCGGLLANHYWNCIFLDILWLDEDYRRQGFGEKLMHKLEDIAREKGVTLIHLDTHEFQAPSFYEKLGYEVFGVLQDSPFEYKRYFMKKEL